MHHPTTTTGQEEEKDQSFFRVCPPAVGPSFIVASSFVWFTGGGSCKTAPLLPFPLLDCDVCTRKDDWRRHKTRPDPLDPYRLMTDEPRPTRLAKRSIKSSFSSWCMAWSSCCCSNRFITSAAAATSYSVLHMKQELRSVWLRPPVESLKTDDDVAPQDSNTHTQPVNFDLWRLIEKKKELPACLLCCRRRCRCRRVVNEYGGGGSLDLLDAVSAVS